MGKEVRAPSRKMSASSNDKSVVDTPKMPDSPALRVQRLPHGKLGERRRRRRRRPGRVGDEYTRTASYYTSIPLFLPFYFLPPFLSLLFLLSPFRTSSWSLSAQAKKVKIIGFFFVDR